MQQKQLRRYLKQLSSTSSVEPVRIELATHMHSDGPQTIRMMYPSTLFQDCEDLSSEFICDRLMKDSYILWLLNARDRYVAFMYTLRNFLKQAYLKKEAQIYFCSLDPSLPHPIKINNVRETPMDHYWTLEMFSSMLSVLTLRELTAFKLRYVHQFRRKQVAKRMRIREDSVGRLLKSAIRKLKEHCSTRDWFNQFPPSFFNDLG